MSFIGKILAFISGEGTRATGLYIVEGGRLAEGRGGEKLSPRDQVQLLHQIARFAKQEEVKVQVVFEGRDLREVAHGGDFNGVTVFFTDKTAEVPDLMIKLARSAGRSCVVITSDRALESRAASMGFKTMRASTLKKAMEGGGVSNGGGGGEFNPGNTRWTLAGFTPEVAQNITFGGGFRLVMPTGYNNTAYSAAQWAMGPQLAMTFTPKNAGAFSFFSPSVRYMMGMTPVSPRTTLMRTLELYPATGFQVTPKLKVAFWDETGITMSARTGKWFVPADAMLTYSFDNHWGASVGGAAQLVNESFNYFWSTYGRIMYTF